MAITILRCPSYSRRRMAIVNPGYDWKKHCVVYVTTAILALSLFALSSLFLGESAFDNHTTVTEVYAQHDVETYVVA